MNIDYNLNFTPDAPENITIQPEDIEAPIISYTLINSEYILNSLPEIFNFSAQDSGVGIYKISATLDGNPITASQTILFEQLGSHEIKITAEDFVGNLATEIITYDVIYSFGGFLPPLKSDGSGVYKLGRTLPIKFHLTETNGQYISTATAQLFIAKISNGIVGNDKTSLSTSNADTGNIFRYDSTDNQYVYNLLTNTLSPDSWQLKIVLDDGKYYIVVISIK
ncbi:MAG: PxKF domain-containing protein [Patescibacteria group bacterium]